MSFLLALLLPLVAANPLDARSGISWSACDAVDGPYPVQCGSIKVPLDYTDAASEKLDLQLVRVPAVTKPSQGSILLNFGGPGSDGLSALGIYSQPLIAATGGAHDLVLFVPRGTNNTIPFSCYDSSEERTLANYQHPLLVGNSSDTAPGRIWADARVFDATCAAAQNKTGRFVGTAFAARDMMQIVDALGEDGMLRYWGISYGTLLGATVAAMFPDRMDKVVLDGVVNPYEYYGNREVEAFTDTDKVLTGFCKGCIAHPANCSLAKGTTAAKLEASIYALLDDIKFNPIVVPVPGSPVILDYSNLKAILFSSLYFPSYWPAVSVLLDALMTKNTAQLLVVFGQLQTILAELVEGEALNGIKCSDTSDTRDSLASIQPTLLARRKKSLIGGDTSDYIVSRCASWPLPAAERYSGSFHVKTKKPMLIIGNTYDPVTPLASARNVSAGMEGSRLLQREGYGHSSFSQASLCTVKAAREYFVNGKLPTKGKRCPVDATLFDGTDGWTKVLAMLA